jgi:hypothetical protein
MYFRNAFLLAILSAAALAAPLGGVMAGVDQESQKVTVYYLSPSTLTRANMTPEGLKKPRFRVDTKDFPGKEITELFEETHSTEHTITGRSTFVYDFRLCLVSDVWSVCFSGDATVGVASSKPFLLSTSEKDRVAALFSALNAQQHGSGHNDSLKPQ